MNQPQYPDLQALIINCTLKPSPGKQGGAESHTDRLLQNVTAILDHADAHHEIVRAVDFNLAPGVQADMREDGWPNDQWLEIADKIRAADILMIATPIWLGEESSVCRQVIERLYGMSSELNDKGQSALYNKVGGCFITGNEDGIKHIAMSVLYALSHIGFTIPPQADAGWIGEAGPGPSYGDKRDDGSFAGLNNNFTRKNTTIATWNILHLAAKLKATPYANYGNDRTAWEDGETFGHPTMPGK